MRLIEIQALNFMRFNKIQLKRIPEKGLFCIQGENESGKSTLGALLYFAFAGVGPKGEIAEDLINWEKSQLKLKITFKIDNKTYQLMRQVDRDGSNFSRLVCGEKTLARGNTSIRNAMATLCQYQPDHLDKSFLITHRIIQQLATEPRVDHLEYMLNINKLKALAESAKGKEEKLVEVLENHQKAENNLVEEKTGTGYDAERQKELIQTQSEQTQKKAELEQQLQALQDQQTGLQGIQDQISDGAKQLPSKFGEDTNAELEQLAPNLIEKFNQLHVVEKTKESLMHGTELLGELHDFLKQSKVLHSAYEGHLTDLRQQLGSNEKKAPEKSLIGKTEKAYSSMKSSMRTQHFWTISTLISFFLFGAIVLTVGIRPAIAKAIKTTPLNDMLNGGSLTPLANFLRDVLQPGAFGIPLDPRFLGSVGLVFVALVISILMVLFYRKKSSQLREQHEEALKAQDQLQQIYNKLLAADFKDLAETGSIIEGCNNDELIQLYHSFKSDHPNISEENFQMEPIIRKIKDHLEESQQNLSLDMHRLHNQLEEQEQELSKL